MALQGAADMMQAEAADTHDPQIEVICAVHSSQSLLDAEAGETPAKAIKERFVKRSVTSNASASVARLFAGRRGSIM